MPNWIEGTLKLRGKFDDIRRFFNNELGNNSDYQDVREQVIDNSSNTRLEFTFKDEPHIKGTRRAFITSDSLLLDDCDTSGEMVACVNVKQAWTFIGGIEDEQVLRNISDKYNLDLRLYGIECGMETVEELILLRSHRLVVSRKRYEDWMWECPFPNMGG